MTSYIQENSGLGPLYPLDPRVKLIWLIFAVSIVLLSHSWAVALGALLLLIPLYLASGISPAVPLVELRAALLFMLLPILINAIFGSLEFGLMQSVKLFFVVLLSLLYVYTTRPSGIMQSLAYFRVPKDIAFAVGMTLYFIPLQQEKLSDIRVAQAARGYRGRNPIPLIVPFFHSLFEKAEALSISLESRGFNPDRIIMPIELRMGAADYSALALLAISLIAVLKSAAP